MATACLACTLAISPKSKCENSVDRASTEAIAASCVALETMLSANSTVHTPAAVDRGCVHVRGTRPFVLAICPIARLRPCRERTWLVAGMDGGAEALQHVNQVMHDAWEEGLIDIPLARIQLDESNFFLECYIGMRCGGAAKSPAPYLQSRTCHPGPPTSRIRTRCTTLVGTCDIAGKCNMS